MKKGLTITLIVLAILAVLFAIFIIINKNISEDSTGIIMTIKEGTLTKTSATVLIKDNNKKHCYGEDYSVEKRENGKWKSVETKGNYIVKWPAYYPGKTGKLDFNIDWSERYGELENGEYRIVKTVSTSDGEIELYAEFTIE